MGVGIDYSPVHISRNQFLQSRKGLPQKLEKPSVFSMWSFWRGEPRTLQLDINSWLIQEAYLICDQYSGFTEGRVGRCRAQIPRWNNLFLINLLHVASHFSQSFQMCYKRLQALGPESTTAVALTGKKKRKTVDYKQPWSFPHTFAGWTFSHQCTGPTLGTALPAGGATIALVYFRKRNSRWVEGLKGGGKR